MLRFGRFAVASGFFLSLVLSPAVQAGPQQPANQPGTSQTQSPDDQGGPPTLRHNKPGSSQTDQEPATQNGSLSQNTSGDPAQPAAQPNAAGATSGQPASAQPAPPPPPPPADAPPLREESRMQLIRYVDGEFVKVMMPLPGGKDGYHLKAGAPPDQDSLRRALTFGGVVLNVGDSAQITKLEFHDREIQLDINGGAKGQGHSTWRDHLQVGMGSGVPISTRTTTTPEDVPVVQPKKGATIFLDFDRPVPEMTGDQLKAYLARVLDFSKRSAAVQYADSLPPQVRDAIADKRVVVGMDHDEVTAALGRPERKVRERDADGNDTEDWIYGTPPEKTIFVTFQGDKVVRVTQYP